MIPEHIQHKIHKILSSKYSNELRIFTSVPLGGGDINSAARLETSHGSFFVKWNSASRYPAMFEKEARGLQLLAESNTLKIPEVVLADEAGPHSFLILEYLESAAKEIGFWENLGTGLAKLHQCTAEYFGLDEDNYIGSLSQSNAKKDNWIDFFIEERISYMLKIARDYSMVDSSLLKAADRLFNRLGEIMPEEPSSLLHGDLWSGNYMVGNRGEACLIDPAVYYGHREMDLAMTKLFGGFSDLMYEAYHEEYPLEKGWEQRVEICNLYPLLVHVNLFGGGYVHQVEGILNRF